MKPPVGPIRQAFDERAVSCLRLLWTDSLGQAAVRASASASRARELAQRELHARARRALQPLFCAYMERALGPESFLSALGWPDAGAPSWAGVESLRALVPSLPPSPVPKDSAVDTAAGLLESWRALGLLPGVEFWARARLIRAQGGPKRAEHYVRGQLARASAGGNAALAADLAACLLDQRKPKRACALLEPLAPGGHPWVLWLLGWAHLVAGDPERARRAHARLIESSEANGSRDPFTAVRLPAPLQRLREEVPHWSEYMQGRHLSLEPSAEPTTGRASNALDPSESLCRALAAQAVFVCRLDEHGRARIMFAERSSRPATARMQDWPRRDPQAAELLALETQREIALHRTTQGPLPAALHARTCRAIWLKPLPMGKCWLRVEFAHHLLPELLQRGQVVQAALLASAASAAHDHRVRVKPWDAGRTPKAPLLASRFTKAAAQLGALAPGTAFHWWGYWLRPGAEPELVASSDPGQSPPGRGESFDCTVARRVRARLVCASASGSRALEHAAKAWLASAGEEIAIAAASEHFVQELHTRSLPPVSFDPGFAAERAFVAQLLVLAASDEHACIAGPRGMGRTVAARWIWLESERRAKPLLTCDWNGARDDGALETSLDRARGATLIARLHGSWTAAQRRDWEARASSRDVRLLLAVEDGLGDPADRVLRVPSIEERRARLPAVARFLCARSLRAREAEEAYLDDQILASVWRSPWPGGLAQLARVLEDLIDAARPGDWNKGADLRLFQAICRQRQAPLLARLAPVSCPKLLVEQALALTCTADGRPCKRRAARWLGWSPGTLLKRLRSMGETPVRGPGP